MAKVIAGRYKLDSELIDTNVQISGIETWWAADLQTSAVLQIHRVPRAKATELTHRLLITRATELQVALPPIFYPLNDYDFDTQSNCYYFHYHSPKRLAKPLHAYLMQSPQISSSKALLWLLEIATGIRDLHRRKIAHGSLGLSTVLIPTTPDESEPSIRIQNVGLVGLVNLLGNGKDSLDPDTLFERDRHGFTEIAAVLLNSPKEENAILSAISEPNPEYDIFQQFVPICAALQKFQRTLEQGTSFYLSLTKKAIEVLVENGFIAEPNSGYACDFLQQELDRGAMMSVDYNHGTEGKRYYLITSQLQIVCAPERDRRLPRCLAAVTVHIHNPAALTEMRESAQPIAYQFRVVENSFQCPQEADITPLLETIEDRSAVAEKAESAKLERKFYMRDWTALLEELRQRLDRYRVSYSDWELVDNDTAILVRLARKSHSNENDFDQDDFEALTEETIFCLSADEGGSRKSRPIPVGYLEDRQADTFKIGLLPGVDVAGLRKRGEITIDNRQERAVLKRQQEAIARLRHQESANPRLATLVLDAASLRINNAPEPDLWFQNRSEFKQIRLDSNQQTAVRRALATQDIYLIQGPPGTGKTSVIAEIVLQVYQKDPQARILISSQSNVAVNNALEKIVNVHKGLQDKVVRIGKREKAGSALNLLFDEQIKFWIEQTRKRSQDFLGKEEQELTKGMKGLDLLIRLDALEQAQGTLQTKFTEQTLLQERLQAIARQYTEMETLAQEVIGIQKKLTTLDERTKSDSVSSRWHAVVDVFRTEYMPWAQNLLAELTAQTQLDGKKTEAETALASLSNQIDELRYKIKAAETEIDLLLRTAYGKRLRDLEDPRKFVLDQNVGYEERRSRLDRLRSLAAKWSDAMGNRDSMANVFAADCRIFGGTCIGIAGHPVVGNMDFDWVIVDEAGRATPPEILVPMVKGRRIILVGDHKQLPPVINQSTQSAAEDLQIDVTRLKMSLFQDLFEEAEGARYALDTQYRMHPAIGELVSTCFYDGKLRSGIQPEDRRHGLSIFKRPVLWRSIQGEEQKEPGGTRYYNQAEADVIVQLLEQIKNDSPASQSNSLSVGIIAGYQEQKKYLRSKIGAVNWGNLSIEVDTVDAYQGRERDVIIYSVVRSNTEGNIGFLRDARRLNVALSRAKSLLIIVGNDTTVFDTKGSSPFQGVLNFIRSNPKQCLLEKTR